MDLMLADSKILQHIVEDSLKRSVGEDGAEKMYATLRLKDEKASNLLRSLNEMIIRGGYGLKMKEILERLGEELSSRIDVAIRPESFDIIKNGTDHVNIELTNRFDVPLVFEVTLEDRDNFLPVIFNKLEGNYFNNFTSESIIDTGEAGRFKYKIGWDGNSKPAGTTLFVVVRSREIEGLNWIGKVRVNFVKS